MLSWLGLFFIYLNGPLVVEIFKGAIQPLTIGLGLLALAAAILGKRAYRKINATVAGLLLMLGFYGLYDEYYAVIDFFSGFIPLALLVSGFVAVISGIKKVK